MQFDLSELDVTTLIAAAETDDEIGTIVRFHLLIEQKLSYYLGLRLRGEISEFVKEPREFSAKLSLAAAFGMPTSLVRASYRLNTIRNKLAHRVATPIDKGDLKQLEIAVDKITENMLSFKSCRNWYIELPTKAPVQRFAFGDSPRTDLVIALATLFAAMTAWLKALNGAGDT